MNTCDRCQGERGDFAFMGYCHRCLTQLVVQDRQAQRQPCGVCRNCRKATATTWVKVIGERFCESCAPEVTKVYAFMETRAREVIQQRSSTHV